MAGAFQFGFDLPDDPLGSFSACHTNEDTSISSQQGDHHKENSARSGVRSVRSVDGTRCPPLVVLGTDLFDGDDDPLKTNFETISLIGPSESNGITGEMKSSTRRALEPLRRVALPSALRRTPSSVSVYDKTSPEAEGQSSNQHPDERTDLIPGVYEGGLKVWECSLDLCRHLASEIGRLHEGTTTAVGGEFENDCLRALSRQGSILELGCGHGLPACLILREGLKRRRQRRETVQKEMERSRDKCCVLFSDYNEFVLKDATIPNVLLNTAAHLDCTDSDELQQHAAMVAGDWMELSERLQKGTLFTDFGQGDKKQQQKMVRFPSDGRFDLILAAETTYTSKSAQDTALLLRRHLKVNTGVGLVATKRYYFGVGGGSDAFREATESKTFSSEKEREGCELSVETVQVYDNGIGNIRELLRVRLISCS